jgi:dihydroorotase/N-acyl-D-amino-acid deacylase
MLRGIAVLVLALPPCAGSPLYDLIIQNARVIDGTGAPWFRADVAVKGDAIMAAGRLEAANARRVLDAGGLALAPGFIDTHSHGLRGLLDHPAAENLIRQGVTTIIEGPDGSSPLPVGPFLEKMSRAPMGVNFGLLAGHGTIRSRVMGSQNRRASAEEIERMKPLMREAMEQGAFGLSTGLFYVPGNFAAEEEVVELARIAGALGGIHTSHMRDEAAGVVESVAETIRIGERGRLPTQVTHHKIIGRPNWGRSVETLELIEQARRRGVDVTIDQYPYTASSTGTGALFPQWSLAGGAAALKERLAAPEQRARIKSEIVRRILEDRGAGDPANVVIAGCASDPSLAGKTLAAITRERGREATPEGAAETAIELQTAGGCAAIYHAIGEEDVERIMRYPHTMIASDGGIPAFGVDSPHPRSYGTFARVLGLYVREKKVLTLEEAVRKMTSLPAQRFSIWDRGVIRPGMKADLVLFDPETVADKAGFLNPHQYAVGVRAVWVNGSAALEDGRMTGKLGGRVLYGPGKKRK